MTFIVAAFLYVQFHQSSFAKVVPGSTIGGDGFLDEFIEFVLAALAPREVHA